MCIKMGVHMFVCLSVGMWRAVQGRFWCRFDPRPPAPWAWGLETIKAEGHILKMLSRLQIKPGSAAYFSKCNIIFRQ